MWRQEKRSDPWWEAEPRSLIEADWEKGCGVDSSREWERPKIPQRGKEPAQRM